MVIITVDKRCGMKVIGFVIVSSGFRSEVIVERTLLPHASPFQEVRIAQLVKCPDLQSIDRKLKPH